MMEMTECILEAKFQREKTYEEHRHGAVVAENKSSHMLLWEARACPWGGNSSRRATPPCPAVLFSQVVSITAASQS